VRQNLKIRDVLCLAGLVFWISGCGLAQSGSGEGSRELTILAASSLTDAFGELADLFEAQHPGLHVLLNFAGSSQLAAQLSEGIIADVFASANISQMNFVIDEGFVETELDTVFVTNRLTIIVPIDNPAGINSLLDLSRPGMRLLVAVEGVPVREYTDELVAGLGVDFQVKFYKNVVSEEDNVRQVTAKIALGEADAGLVYTSDVTASVADLVKRIDIPEDQNVIASYSIAPLIHAPDLESAQAFIEFVLSPEGQEILSRWGFQTPIETVIPLSRFRRSWLYDRV
jgi:molybdate transport system substrate-binding protein